MRFNSSSKTSHKRFAKMSGRINSLYLGASLAPRMEHAASQIHDSRDLPLLPFPFPIPAILSRGRPDFIAVDQRSSGAQYAPENTPILPRDPYGGAATLYRRFVQVRGTAYRISVPSATQGAVGE